MDRKTLLTNGLIPPATACPFAGECTFKQADECKHKGTAHPVSFSCATARGFDLVRRDNLRSNINLQEMSDEELESLQSRVWVESLNRIENKIKDGTIPPLNEEEMGTAKLNALEAIKAYKLRRNCNLATAMRVVHKFLGR